MRPSGTKTASRREFLRSSARYGWFVGLGTALGWLVFRNGAASSCARTSPCVSCPAFQDCALPPALDARTGVPRTSSDSSDVSDSSDRLDKPATLSQPTP